MKMYKKRIDVMIDLETTSCRQDAGILSISMIPFEINMDYDEGREEDREKFPIFHKTVNLNSCFFGGHHFDPGTQDWWSKQKPEVKERMMNGVQIQEAVKELYDSLKNYGEEYELYPWSKGTDFDFPILEYCFEKYLGEKAPYKYYNKRDVRTFISEFTDIRNMVFDCGDAHDSLDDCRHQIKQVKEAYKRICR